VRIAAWAAAACLACCVAQAQGPPGAPANSNQRAKDLAQRLGREMSVEGLEALVAARNLDLFAQYERGWREVTSNRKPQQPLPPAVEAIIIRNYQDPVMGPALRTLCTSNWTHYQTRELFDLMFAEWRSGKVRPSTYPIRDAVLQTELKGIEAPLLEWIRSPNPPQMEDLKQVIGFLGRRKYEPAIPAIVGYMKGGDRWTVRTADAALIDIATPESIEPVLARMAALRGDAPTAEQKEDREFLTSRIAALPETFPLPYARFKAALPENTRKYSVAWLTKRKDMTAMPDVLEYMGDEGGYGPAIQALIATDSPEIWKQARARAEQLNSGGRLKGGEYLFAKSMLDEKIANPEKYFAEKRQQAAGQKYYAERSDLEREQGDLAKLRKSEPERYVTAMKAQLAKREKFVRDNRGVLGSFGPQQDLQAIGMQYLVLGHYVRFRLKRPRDALELYAAAQRDEMIAGGFAIGDTWQHDLSDPKRAATEYRNFLGEIRQMPRRSQREEEALLRWADRWVQAQVAYLEKRTTFTGTLKGDDLAGATMATFLGAASVAEDVFDGAPLVRLVDAPGSVDRAQVVKMTQALPPSAFALAYGTPFLGYLPDSRSILAFLQRQDPAGYASACYFAIIDLAEKEGAKGRTEMMVPGVTDPARGKALREAKARFMAERKIKVDAKDLANLMH
jgi:hypothetical protein